MTDKKPPLGETMDTLSKPTEPKTTTRTKPAERKTDVNLRAGGSMKFTSPPAAKVGEVFNTYRVGEFEIEKGDTVTLTDNEGTELGTAEVVKVASGQWADVKGFAGDNHEFGSFPQAEAESLLYSALGRYYPDMKSNSRITVLYLRRTA